ncbi:MAG: pirin family protein [Bacteroidota bacterium]
MKRKSFLKTAILGSIGVATAKISGAKNSPQVSSVDQVGFNHLPTKEIRTMKTVLHKADTRGHANHGWLDSHHTFSFASYYNPDRVQFGTLRVLNDDVVEGGKGFGKHPHDNMEIVSIPLSGDLKHEDSMGNDAIIKEGDIQVMSAGTGIFHSEYNNNEDQAVKFLQIWLFPKDRNVDPRYDQISIRDVAKKNELYQVLSPNSDDEGVWVHQDAWFFMGDFDAGKSDTYKIKKEGNGVYVFVLEGELKIDGKDLQKRDGLGIWETDAFNLEASSDAKVLLMEVPMNA